MLENTDKYFEFLKQYGFSDPIQYSYVRDIHRDYIKGNLVISIAYEGNFWVEIIKTKHTFPSLATGLSKVTDLDFKDKKSYDLNLLDSKKKLFKSINCADQDEKNLLYYSSLLKNNPEILNGNLRKFSFTNRFLRLLGLKV